MLALRKTGPAPGLTLQHIPEPTPCGPDEVLVQVHAAGICGSDLHIADWHDSTFAWLAERLPVTMGHEFAGTVTAVGAEVGNLRPGDRVTVQPTLCCGRCAACQAGDAERCSAVGFLGVTREGAFCCQAKVPAANCYTLAPHVDLALAALAEPLAVAHNALRTGQVPPGHGAGVGARHHRPGYRRASHACRSRHRHRRGPERHRTLAPMPGAGPGKPCRSGP